MIARVWHGATLKEHADTYLAYLNQTGVKDCLATPGNRGVRILHKETNGHADFVFISFWASLEDIMRFAGANPVQAVYYPQDRAFLLELEPTVQHYEVVEFQPAPGI